MSGAPPDFTIVIPVKDEEGNLEPLFKRIDEACSDHAFEVVLIDDGSTDRSDEIINSLKPTYPWIRLLRHDKSAGKSAAVWAGAHAARAPLVVTIDGDGQNPPEEIPRLIARLTADDAPALVAGQRVGRQDTAAKKLASKFANRLRGWLLNDHTRDTACGFKAFRRDPFHDLPLFDNLHRLSPAPFQRAGHSIAHLDVKDEPRLSGQSKYTNFGRAMVGIWDLIGVTWLLKRQTRVAVEEDQ